MFIKANMFIYIKKAERHLKGEIYAFRLYKFLSSLVQNPIIKKAIVSFLNYEISSSKNP